MAEQRTAQRVQDRDEPAVTVAAVDPDQHLPSRFDSARHPLQCSHRVFEVMDDANREGEIETIESEGKYQRAVAHWPGDLAAPGSYHLLGIVYDKAGKELTRVAPRMVSANMQPGY